VIKAISILFLLFLPESLSPNSSKIVLRYLGESQGEQVFEPTISPVFGMTQELGSKLEERQSIVCSQSTEDRKAGEAVYKVVVLSCEGGRKFVIADIAFR
jgi:hypothetical protein